MIKSIYISPKNPQGLEKSKANNLIVNMDGLTSENWQKLRSLGTTLSIALDAFKKTDCPANPQVIRRLVGNVEEALEYNPETIWFDGLRFGGECTDILEEDAKRAHPSCEYCQGKDRVEIIYEILKNLREIINSRSKIGIFVVVFREDQSPSLVQTLGLDYKKFSEIVEEFSPMLYQQMLDKPISYISEYTAYLSDLTKKLVLPIIQIKSMPDDLEDMINEEIIKAEYIEAIKSPSVGVCFFWWQHALEKDKTAVVTELFS